MKKLISPAAAVIIFTVAAILFTMLAFSACAVPVNPEETRAPSGTSPVTAKQSTAIITVEAPSDQPQP